MQMGILDQPFKFLSNMWSARTLVALMNFSYVVRQHYDFADGGNDGDRLVTL